MCQQRCWRWSRRIVAVTAAQTTALFGAHCRQVDLIVVIVVVVVVVLSGGHQSSKQSQSNSRLYEYDQFPAHFQQDEKTRQ